MINLSGDDRRQLITLLQSLPALATERSRREVLKNADLGELIPMIDISGNAFVATSEIVSFLSQYGRLTFEEETLGRFLNTLKGQGFTGFNEQKFLDKLLTK